MKTKPHVAILLAASTLVLGTSSDTWSRTPAAVKQLKAYKANYRLVPANDRAFLGPRYLWARFQHRGTDVVLRDSGPAKAFIKAWKRVAPEGTRPIAFDSTGSDANNDLAYHVATAAARRSSPNRKIKRGTILYMSGAFVSRKGEAAGASFRDYPMAPDHSSRMVESPVTALGTPGDSGTLPKAEVTRLEGLEKKAIQRITELVDARKNSAQPVGAVHIEPIQGAKGVLHYRPQFMTRLRKHCDNLGLVIIADEVLTGGGRTGKFFGYQHYKDFKPDYAVFGKGLPAGIAAVDRGKGHPPDKLPDFKVNADALLKGTQVLRRIRSGRLMERARVNGEFLKTKLAKLDPADAVQAWRPVLGTENKVDLAGPTRGHGLLLSTRVTLPGESAPVGRIMPPLTTPRRALTRLVSGLERLQPAANDQPAETRD